MIKLYKIHKNIPLLGLKKGEVAKLSETTAEQHKLKEYKPKAKAPDLEIEVANAN